MEKKLIHSPKQQTIIREIEHQRKSPEVECRSTQTITEKGSKETLRVRFQNETIEPGQAMESVKQRTVIIQRHEVSLMFKVSGTKRYFPENNPSLGSRWAINNFAYMKTS